MKITTKLIRFAKDEVDNLQSQVEVLTAQHQQAVERVAALRERLDQAIIDLQEAKAALADLKAKDAP